MNTFMALWNNMLWLIRNEAGSPQTAGGFCDHADDLSASALKLP